MANKKRKQEKPVKEEEVTSSRTDTPYIKTSVECITFDYMDKMDVASVEKQLMKWDASLKEIEYIPDFDVYNLIQEIREKDCDLYADYPNTPQSCIGITFSGGYDSTLLVSEAVRKGQTVIPIQVGIKTHAKGMWIIMELTLLDLRRKYPKRICKAICPVPRIEFMGDINGYYIQPTIAYSLAFIDQTIRELLREIQVGFICKDECISYLDEFIGLYKATREFIHPLDVEPVPLTFPLKKTLKWQVLQKLKNNGIYKIPLSTCEHPEEIILGNEHGVIVYMAPCCECPSCWTLNRAIDDDRYKKAIVATFGDDKMPIMDNVIEALK